MNKLTPKQSRFVKNIIAGNNITNSAKMAGYSPISADSTGSRLMNNDKIKQVLAKAGLDEISLSAMLNTSIKSGLGIKATNSDALKGIELSYKLLGYIKDNNNNDNNDNSINIYIKELHNLTTEQLHDKLTSLEAEIIP